MKIFTIIGFVILLNLSVKAQVSLPYYSGFDNTSQQTGWTEYKKAATTFSHWGYASFSAYSAPNCIVHDYSPSTGITLTDNWFVSPVFSINNGGKLDSIRYKFSGFSQPVAGDTVAIYLLNGSQDPSLATSKQLLFDFRNTEYITDNTYRVKTNINLPALSGSSYIAIRYRNTDCSSKWLSVFFDNVAIRGNGVGITELNTSTGEVNIYPNPFSSSTTLQADTLLKNATLTVYNSAGKQVKQIKNIAGQEITLYCDNLSSGLYFILLTQDNKTLATDKFVISDNGHD